MVENWIVSDVKKKRVWVSPGTEDGNILQLSGEGVEVVPDGKNKDMVSLVAKTAYEPIRYKPGCNVREGWQAFKDLLLRNLPCCANERNVIFEWFFNLFLLNIVFPKRGLFLTGQAGSGKTMAVRLFRALAMGRVDIWMKKNSEESVNLTMISEPVVFLENFKVRKFSSSLCKYLKLTSGSATKVSISRNKDENKKEATPCNSLVAIESCIPLAKPPIRRRFFEVEFSERYFRPDFDMNLVVTNLLLQRDLILSAMLKSTAEKLKGI